MEPYIKCLILVTIFILFPIYAFIFTYYSWYLQQMIPVDINISGKYMIYSIMRYKNV